MQVTTLGLGASGQIVNQEPVGPDKKSDRNGRALAGIEKPEREVGSRVRANFKPSGRLRDPAPDPRGAFLRP